MNTPTRRKQFGGDGGSPMKQLTNSPMVQKAMVNYHKIQTELEQNPRLRNDIKIGSIGLLMGVVLGGLMATLGKSVPEVSNDSNGMAGNDLVKDLKGPGWNPIHVFYGKMNHIIDEIPEQWYLKHDRKHKTPKSVEWFGQHGQDVAVAKFFNFKRDGYFVDLASNDAVWASNTFSLEQNLGWKGICIEANPIYWYRLSFRTNCHVVGTVVGKRDFDDVKINLPTDPKKSAPFGGLVGQDFDNKNEKDAEKRYTVSLLTLLDKFNAPKIIDYLSLDVEGAEGFVLNDFPFHKPYSFKVISIERPKDRLKTKLGNNGYKQIYEFDRGDTLWVHRSVYDRNKKFLEEKPHEIKNHKLDELPRTMKS